MNTGAIPALQEPSLAASPSRPPFVHEAADLVPVRKEKPGRPERAQQSRILQGSKASVSRPQVGNEEAAMAAAAAAAAAG